MNSHRVCRPQLKEGYSCGYLLFRKGLEANCLALRPLAKGSQKYACGQTMDIPCIVGDLGSKRWGESQVEGR